MMTVCGPQDQNDKEAHVKVGIYESVDVSDEQRKAIAKTLGQKTATRDDLKEFIWKYGQQWPLMVNGATTVDSGGDAPADPLAALDAALGDDDELAGLL